MKTHTNHLLLYIPSRQSFPPSYCCLSYRIQLFLISPRCAPWGGGGWAMWGFKKLLINAIGWTRQHTDTNSSESEPSPTGKAFRIHTILISFSFPVVRLCANKQQQRHFDRMDGVMQAYLQCVSARVFQHKNKNLNSSRDMFDALIFIWPFIKWHDGT